MKLKNKLIKKRYKKLLGSTNQTHNSSHEMGVTSYKTNQNKSRNLVLNQPNIKGYNKEKKSIKKTEKKIESTKLIR
jgi:hypothetical protein